MAIDYNENKINLQSSNCNSTRQNIQLDKIKPSDNVKCTVYLQNCFKFFVMEIATKSKNCLCMKKKTVNENL